MTSPSSAPHVSDETLKGEGRGAPKRLLLGTVAALGVVMACVSTAEAQSTGSSSLPAITVDAPAAPKKKAPDAARTPTKRAVEAPARRRVVRREPTRSVAAPVVRTGPAVQRGPTPAPEAPASATGPIAGYVPRLSATGTKTATPLIETPQSISIVGAEQIRDQAARSIGEATRYASGVVSEEFGNDTRNDFILIRGFPAQVTGYFLDGLQLASPGFATFKIDPFNLERIEVLKGPASVLYGGSSTGGIINSVSKRPPETPQRLIEAGIDTYGNAFAHFDVGGPVAGTNNQWFYRVEGISRAGGTQTDFTPDNRYSIAPSLTYKPDGATTITVLGSYQKDRTRGLNFLPYFGTVQAAPFGRISTSLFTSDPNLDTFQRNQGLIGYSVEHKFNDTFTVRQNLRYSDLRIDDRTIFGVGYDGNPANANLARFNFSTVPHLNELAVDTQAEARFRTGPISHVLLAGIDYKHFTFADEEGFNFASDPDLNLLHPVYGGIVLPTINSVLNFNKQDQLGEYLQEQAKYDHFTLVLSGRHDTLNASLRNGLNPAGDAQSTTNALTGRVGLIYTSDAGVAPYATYATSFDPQIGTNNSGPTPTLLKPQTGQLAEVGVKYQPIGTNLSFTGALYNLVQQNVLTTDPNNPINTLQTGEERSRGFELEAQGTITAGLKVVAAYTGYQLRDTRDLNTALLGKVPTAVPQNFGSVFLDYTIQAGAFRGLGGGAGVRYFGGSYASQDNTFGVPSYALADFALHYERDGWRAAINLTNAFDRTYVSTCSSVTACFYGQRSRATFSLAYRW